MKEDRVYIDHIIECLKWIDDHLSEGKGMFFNDRKTQSAVIRELQTLAESTQRLSSGIKDKHPEVSWEWIAGFRNVLVHDYLGINLERVWQIIENELPDFRSAIQSINEELKD